MKHLSTLRAAGSVFACALVASACAAQSDVGSKSGGVTDHGGDLGASSGAGTGTAASFRIRILASDLGISSQREPVHIDPNLIDTWGLVRTGDGFWMANTGSGYLSLKLADGSVTDRDATSIRVERGITGIAVNHSDKSFQLHGQADCKSASLVVAGLSGKIWGVNPDLDHGRPFVLVDRASAGAAYIGIAVIEDGSAPDQARLVAVDFHNSRLDLFDANLELVPDLGSDSKTPTRFFDKDLPAGYAPFNVAVLDGTIYVAYAMANADRTDTVAGAGLGAIDAYDLQGKLVGRVATGGDLNAPWGMALATDEFGAQFHGALIVGNFGDGRISVVDSRSGRAGGQLIGDTGAPLAIDGLWGLVFGSSDAAARATQGEARELYFAAGPGKERHGEFGVILATDSHTCGTTNC